MIDRQRRLLVVQFNTEYIAIAFLLMPGIGSRNGRDQRGLFRLVEQRQH